MHLSRVQIEIGRDIQLLRYTEFRVPLNDLGILGCNYEVISKFRNAPLKLQEKPPLDP